MRIDIYSDNICPWCYIGKRHLDVAIQELGMTGVELRWHAYQLYPQIPRGGVPRDEFLRARFGESAGAGFSRVREAGAASGINFNFEGLEVIPNTFDSHRLVAYAATENKQHETIEVLMEAGFERGLDIGRREVLADVAAKVGLDEAAVATCLAGNDFEEEVNESLQWCLQAGITGVHLFRLADGEVIQGAQPVPLFRMLLEQAA